MKQLICRAVCAVALATLFPLLHSGPAHAATPPEVVKGQAWLQAQVQANGALANENLSIGTPLQSRAESVQTFKLLSTVPPALADLLAADAEDNTEYLARRAFTLSLAGRNTAAITAQLAARQNPDGGFGGATGYASDALDTALVMMAMAQNNLANSPAGQSARSYLLTTIQTGGGVGTGSDSARINASALAMLALQMYPQDLATANALKQINAWLLLKQGADGSWLKNSNLTALTLAAISPLTSDPAISANATAYLKALQGADGSWGTGDPFLTAVVLRALSITPPPAAAPVSTLTGLVADQSTTTPLYGATVTLSGAATATLTTAADGKINFASLPAGSYTLQIASAGYNTYTGAYQVSTGQNLNIGTIPLTQTPATGIVSGTVTVTAGGMQLAGAGAPLAGVTVTVNTLSAVTDANGMYRIAGVTPGAVTLTASLAGYGSATVLGNILGGQTLTFSPALSMFSIGAAPTTGLFSGKVVAAGTNAPLAGVSIVLNGTASGVTDVNGNFSLTLAPASYNAAFILPGYSSATSTFALTAGASVSAGTIALTQQVTTTTISGVVKDAASGAPLAGAQVQMLNGPVVTTDAKGAYTLSNLLGTAFNLRASATGYVSQSALLTAAQPMNLAQDFLMPVQTGQGLSLAPLQVNPASAANGTDIAVSTVLTSGATAAPANIILTLQVLDATGKVIATAAAYDKTGTTMLGQTTINPGQQLPILFKWNTGQFPAGSYAFVAKVIGAGTVSTANRQGQVLTQAQGSLTIVSGPHFTGSITANPPVLQSGANMPVKLSAVLQNDGNAPVTAQTYQLTITNATTGAVVATQQASGGTLAPNGLLNLSFADWTPVAGGGNFQLDLQAVGNHALGDVIGKVYVGDAATANFTVNQLAVPAGTQNVKGNIHVTGQDNLTGTISDPLTTMIKTAIQRAVTYNDAKASQWITTNGCSGCHVGAQALVGGEMSIKLVPNYDTAQRNIIFNKLAYSQNTDGSITPFYNNVQYKQAQTYLSLWGLNSWHAKQDISGTLIAGANFVMNQQQSDGSWGTDYAQGWWSTVAANTGLNIKNLADVRNLLAQSPVSNMTGYSLMPWAPASNPQLLYYGLGYQRDTVGDAAGNVYVAQYNGGTVSIVKPDGSVQQFMTGLSRPNQMVLGADGTLYVATANGLVSRSPGGAVTTLTTQPGMALTMGPDGNFYMMSWVTVNYWYGPQVVPTVFQVTPQGAATAYFSGTSLSTYSPFSMAFDKSGKLVVVNGIQVLTINADGTSSSLYLNSINGGLVGALAGVTPDGSGGWFAADDNYVYHFDSGWKGSRLAAINNTVLTMNRMPNGKVMICDYSNLYTLENTPYYSYATVTRAMLPGAGKAAVVDAAGNKYITRTGTYYDSGYLALAKPGGAASILQYLFEPNQAALAGDGSLYIPAYNGVWHYVPSTGQLTQLTSISMAIAAVGPDGNIYAVPNWSNKILQITPAGVVSDYIVGGALNGPYSIAFDSSGALLVGNGTGNVVKFNPDKTYSVVVAKTNGIPYGILADGADYLVGTQYGLFRYTSGSSNGTLIIGGAVLNLTRAPDGAIYYGDNTDNLYVLRRAQDPAPYDAAISKAANWLLVDSNVDATDNIQLAFRMIGLGEAQKIYAGTPMGATLQAKMDQVGAVLRSHQQPDGGWGKTAAYSSDSIVTAMVGMGLDYLKPLASDPIVQNAVKLLLNRQQADGSWGSENGVLTTNLAATTWVAIWLPIALDRMGGINTDMTVSMPANVTLANPSIAPASSVANAIGGVDYLWHLIGVKSAGVDVNFDLTLQNMVLNETRPVATDAHLTFTNSFTGQPTNAPIAVPRVTASAFLGLGVTTDQVSYPANTPVNITGAVNNTSTAGVLDGSVKFEVYGADNILVGVVGTFPFSALAAGAQTSLTGTWNTGTVAAGGYYVLASLYDAQNRLAGTAQSAFTVTSVPGGASPGYTGIGGTIAVDRPAYQPFDRVQLANRISNLTQNLGYSGLVAVDTVYRPDGTVLWTQTAGLQPLLAASFIDLPQNLQLATAPAGRYQVVLSVRNASGVEVARAVSGFSVLSTADTGAGLKGTLGALPKIVSQSDPVVINWTALNQGNADFAALPLKLTIIDPASKQIMVQQPYSIALLQGKTYQTAFTWDTSPASVGSTYLAILSATVGGKDIALAQDTFLVTYPPVKLGVTQSSVRNNRVLVWAACNAAEVADKAEGQPKAEGMNGDPHGNAQAMADKDHPESIPACLQTRAAYLDTLLTQLKVPHLITTNRADFKKAFREGRYNVYWLSGGIKLEQSEGGHDAARKERTQGGEGRKQDGKSRQGEVREHGEDNLAEELREAVNRGDSVILDGIKGGESLQEAAGVAYDGQPGADTKGGPSGGEHQAASFPVTGLPFIRQPVTQLTTLGDLFAAQTLSANGQAQKMRLSTGKSQADFLLPPEEAAHDHPDGNRDGQPNAGESQNAGDKAAGSGKATGGGDRNKAQDTPHPADGRHAEEPKPVWPAIVANGYGKGRVLTFGFDLVDTLQNGAAPATWQTLLQNGLGWLLPPLPVPYSGGALVTLETGIQNQARAVDLGVTTLLPAGSTLLQTLPQAVLDANGQPAWAFTLPQAGSQTLQSTLRLPPVTGNHKALTTIDSIKNGVRRRYGEYSYYWQVAASDTLADKIAADLKALVLTARKEQDARSAMLSGLQRAQAQLGRAQYAEAIETQLRVIGQLRRIASVDTGAIRLDLDRLLQQTEWDWLRTGGDKPAPEARHDERPGAQHDERAGEHPGESQDNSRARRAARGQPPQND